MPSESYLTKLYWLNKICPNIMKRFMVEISKGRFKIHGLVQEIGQDVLVSIWGGNPTPYRRHWNGRTET